jgi:hypothetical protein
MPRVPFESVVHESPEPRVVDAPIKEVAVIARRISKAVLNLFPHQPTEDLIVLPGQEQHLFMGMIDLRDASAEALNIQTEKCAIRLGVVTNAEALRESMVGSTDPITTFHTDYRVKEQPDKSRRLHRAPYSRMVAILDGLGSDYMYGTVRTNRARRFVASPAAGKKWEHEMAQQKTALIGEDGQLIRGPLKSGFRHMLRGDFEIGNLPEGVWNEVDPDLLHRMPPDLEDGRVVLDVDIID